MGKFVCRWRVGVRTVEGMHEGHGDGDRSRVQYLTENEGEQKPSLRTPFVKDYTECFFFITRANKRFGTCVEESEHE